MSLARQIERYPITLTLARSGHHILVTIDPGIMESRSRHLDRSELRTPLSQEGREDSEDLLERVYTELRQRAHYQRRRWKGEPSLRTTALAHEAYLKLIAPEERSWETRSHFLAVAATAMRQILVDRARRKRAQKRGGDAPVLSLEALRARLGSEQAAVDVEAEAFIVLNEALNRLERKHPRAARGVECRFFAGMTIEETAEALDVSPATVNRDWKHSKGWLYREMKRIRAGGETSSESSSDSDRREGFGPHE